MSAKSHIRLLPFACALHVVLLLGMGLAGFGACHAAILFEEDFESLAPQLQSAQTENIDASVKGWTHAAPDGWSIDNSKMNESVGVPEWRGWSFTTMPFWVATENQNRDQFTLAEGVLAVADSDEYDDKDNPPPFDSTLVSPAITVPAGKAAHVHWDTMCWELPGCTAQLLVSIDNGPERALKDYTLINLANVEEYVKVPAPDTGRPWSLVLKWRYAGKNQWFWAIDNIRVTDTPPAPPPPLFELGAPEDWPTYRRDNRRGGVTTQVLDLPLKEAWAHTPSRPPAPAWPEPARRDVSHQVASLSATTIYDRVFHVAASDKNVYYSSSADDSVYCLDAAKGKVRWVFTTEGPVRLAPTVTQGRVYFGSDDGCVYCLDAEHGTLLWKYRAVREDRRLPGNGRMISRWPVRSGVVIDRDTMRLERGDDDAVAAPLTAFFTAGLFPEEGVYLCAVDAATGKEVRKTNIDVASQGYMLASPSRFFLPTGRTAPVAVDRTRHKVLGGYEGLGGNFAVIFDDMLVAGPSERGELHINSPELREKVVSAPGIALVATENVTYFLGNTSLTALDRKRYIELSRHITTLEEVKERTGDQNQRLVQLRKERRDCRIWSVPCSAPCTMILAGDTLFVGGENAVTAFACSDGAEVWHAEVQGKAYGLAVSHGRLLVSTDQGAIHCFHHKRWGRRRESRRDAKADSSPYPEDAETERCRQIAGRLIEQSGFTRGYCLVLGAGDGRLAYEIARRSELSVIGLEPDPQKAAQTRRLLAQTPFYGHRITIHQAPLGSLPYQAQTANIVFTATDPALGQMPRTPAAEIARVLRPYGGKAFVLATEKDPLRVWGKDFFDWTIVTDEIGTWGITMGLWPEEAGEWTHTYAEPGNTASSRDELVKPPLELQWFGPPGPRQMLDRHFRNVPPLFKDGRLFIPGDQILYAVDAYNGANLWQVEIPESRRAGVFLESSNMCVDSSRLYLVAERVCHALDVATGEERVVFGLPAELPDVPLEWGYIAHSQDVLVGSARAKGSTIADISNETQFDLRPLWYINMHVALSQSVFGLNRPDGRPLWTYTSGRIIDSTLTLGEGRVYFIETQSPKALADTAGRLPMFDVIDGGEQFLVALDLHTGAVVYRRAVDMSNLQQPCFLSLANGVLLLSGSKLAGGEAIRVSGRKAVDLRKGDEHVHYYFYAFDAASGAPRWQADHATELSTDGGHGEYNRHPTINGNIAYAWPFAYNLNTGKRLPDWKFDRHGHGCGGISASMNALFWRGHNPWMYDLHAGGNLPDGGGAQRINAVTRPGCWINIIPAGGLVLIPEASAGCTCGYAIQTSLAYRPR